jgi:hypothetical protein
VKDTLENSGRKLQHFEGWRMEDGYNNIQDGKSF